MKLRSLMAVLPLALACGPDAQPLECHGAPDFKVLIRAADGPLPADTKIELRYGALGTGAPETLTLATPGTPQALFCFPADHDGKHDEEASPLGGEVAPRARGAAGASGAGGADGAVPGPIVALFCELWTNGPANLDIKTDAYPETKVKLETRKRVCTVDTIVELSQPDGGTQD
jgi:hypothetical protein